MGFLRSISCMKSSVVSILLLGNYHKTFFWITTYPEECVWQSEMNFSVSYVFVNLNKYVSDYDYSNDEFLYLEIIPRTLFSIAYDLKYVLA